jgi:hypothetical protein
MSARRGVAADVNRRLFRTARATPPPRRRRQSVPTAGPHDFEADLSLPATHDGRMCCRRCGKPGEKGDLQHPVGALPAPSLLPPVAPEVLDEQARRLGERPDAA